MAFAEDIDEVYIGESVISASGYEQDIRNAPASISVIDKEEIMSRPLRDLGDAVQDVPGVYVEANKTGGNKISMRGFSSTYTLILIDGKRQNVAQGFDASGFADGTYSSFMPPPSMIERIEVIRGPASTIYGSDAMGGVINIITKKHSDKISSGYQLDARFAEHNETFGHQFGVNGYITAPLVEKMLSMNVRAGYRFGEQNSFYKPAGLATSAQGSNPYATWSPTGFTHWNVGFRINYTPESHNNLYFDGEVYFSRTGSLNSSRNSVTAIRDYYKVNTVLNHDADYEWGKLNSYLQYSQTMWGSHVGVPIGGSSGSSVVWFGGKNGNRALGRNNIDVIYQTTYNKDFDLGDYGVIIFNGGIYYMYEQLTAYATSAPYRNAMHMNQVALFGEGEYIINDFVSTTLGLRLNVSDKFNAIAMPNPRFYVNYNPAQWVTLKAGVSSGVLVPQLSYLYEGYTVNSNSIAIYGNKNLKPETSWNYELSAIFDTRDINVTVTGFYTDFNNQVSSVSGINQGQSLDGQVCDASGTTAQAVMELNAEDGGNRKFILVQLNETIDEKKSKVAFDFCKNELKSSVPLISDITIERVKRAGGKVRERNDKVDTSFNIYALQDKLSKDYESSDLLQGSIIVEARDIKALLESYRLRDGINLNAICESINLQGYNGYKVGDYLYLLESSFKTEHLAYLLKQIAENKDFNIRHIVYFVLAFESKMIREIHEGVESFNKKNQKSMHLSVYGRI